MVYVMVCSMAWWAWHGIWYGLSGMAWEKLWHDGHGIIYGISVRSDEAWHVLWHNLAYMAWYTVWHCEHGMVYDKAWGGESQLVHGMECLMVWS